MSEEKPARVSRRDLRAAQEAELAEVVEKTPTSVLILDGTSGTGMAMIRQLQGKGVQVAASTDEGSYGAAAIRELGAVPMFSELDRATSIRSAIDAVQATAVVHLLGTRFNGLPHVSANPAEFDETMISSAEALVEAVKGSSVERVIFVSAAMLYGDQHGHEVDESTRLSGLVSKSLVKAEKIVLKSTVPAIILRAGFVYGGGSEALKQAAADLGRGAAIDSGDGLGNYIQEEDLASAIIKAIELDDISQIKPIMNIVDGSPIPADTFAEALGHALGVGKPGLRKGGFARMRMGDYRRNLLDQSLRVSNDLAKAQLNWQPDYADVIDGLDRAAMSWRAGDSDTVAEAREVRELILSWK
ncbi:hypothetical protein MASR2M15_00370 [Anaerolineales bacterium]